ncbi:hypothetical protein CH35J_007887 [Colletotrichum higginsianum]|uniref:Uncharacterized protein n=1 Tax=Colletotrichum higginsianum TaxID=80884 RepID=A0A4T0VS54_9PEZI|nr:hypothetical protein CH35J_007887 [Colletotrichum higginsianum]
MGSEAPSAEVVCSIVFGIVATTLAMVGIIQNCFRKRAKERDLKQHQSWYGNSRLGSPPKRVQTFPLDIGRRREQRQHTRETSVASSHASVYVSPRMSEDVDDAAEEQ